MLNLREEAWELPETHTHTRHTHTHTRTCSQAKEVQKKPRISKPMQIVRLQVDVFVGIARNAAAVESEGCWGQLKPSGSDLLGAATELNSELRLGQGSKDAGTCIPSWSLDSWQCS